MELIFEDEVYAVVGAAMDVHSTLGCRFHEPIYQEAMEIELLARSIPFSNQQKIAIRYKGHILKKEYVPDLICYDAIVVELKALEKLSSKEVSQVVNYLKASELRVGLLVNFASLGKLEWQRIVL